VLPELDPWDGNDNLKTISEAGKVFTYDYDELDRRVAFTMPNGVKASYGYDLPGRLGYIEYKQESGNVNSVYTHGAGVDEPLMRRGTTTEFYQADALGSIIALTNNSGTITTSYAYSPYGLKQTAGIASSNPYAFTGREDDGTGLYFYRARYYSPSQKRFIAEDPLEFGGGDSNFYSYVSGDPANKTDPSGFTWETNPWLFAEWVLETGSSKRYYGPSDPSTQELAKAKGAQKLRDAYLRNNCDSTKKVPYETFDSILDSFTDLSNGTQFQVGGYLGRAIKNGNGTVTYRITNQLSIYSFFYHIPGLPHKQRGGDFPFMGNLDQVFEWIEKEPCGCQR